MYIFDSYKCCVRGERVWVSQLCNVYNTVKKSEYSGKWVPFKKRKKKNLPDALYTGSHGIQFRSLTASNSQKIKKCSGRNLKPMKLIQSTREAGPSWMQSKFLLHFSNNKNSGICTKVRLDAVWPFISDEGGVSILWWGRVSQNPERGSSLNQQLHVVHRVSCFFSLSYSDKIIAFESTDKMWH